jgi:hypothetical protein
MKKNFPPMNTNEEQIATADGNRSLHQNNAAEWAMVVLIAPAIFAAHCWFWLGARLKRLIR